MGVYAGDTVPYLTETFNVAPDVQRYIGNALVRDNDDVKPTLDLDFANNKSLTDDVSGDNLITFTRTTAGTYVDSEGIIRTSGGNLIRNSEEVVNGIWSLFEVDVTPNATIAPDNTNTADFVFENTNATQHRFDTPVFTSTAGTVYTYSIFLKANGRDTVTLQLKQIGEALGVYELTGDGTAHSFGNGGSGTIIKYPNGWYRCILTTTATASVTAYGRVFLQTNATEGGLGVYVWGAQIEEGPTASQYLKTTTAPNYFPRYDHDPVTLESLGLLIEESSTNSFTRSEFETGYLAGSNVRIGLLSDTTFDGLFQNTGVAFGYDGSTSSYLYKSGITASTTATISLFVRMDDGLPPVFANDSPSSFANDFAIVCCGDTSNFCNPLDYKIEDYGNGLYRVSASGTSGSLPNNSGIIKYAGNTNRTFTTSGYQAEVGKTFPTSYIPTDGTPGGIMRGPDIATITGTNFSSWYSQSEGTVFADAICNGLSGGSSVSFVGHIHDGSTNNYIDVLRYQPTARNIVTVGASPQSILSSSVALGSYHKSAQAYKINDFSLSIDGASVITDNSGTLPSPSILTLGNDSSNGRALNGHISRLTYYPTRLSNATLQELTQDNPTNLPATITPPIVTDGLVLNLDAGTPSSYSGTGTTWFDKTDNSSNGTLINGPTFSTDGQGSIVFDGANAYVTSNVTTDTRNKTYSIWCTVPPATSEQQVFSIGNASYTTLGLTFNSTRNGNSQVVATSGLYNIANNTGSYGLTSGLSTGIFYNFTLTTDSNGNLTALYINGQSQSSRTQLSRVYILEESFRLAFRSDDNFPYTGKIAQVSVYNRALTQQEVKQNYQALLPRFAVTDGLVLNLDAGNRKSYPATGTTWTDLTGNGNDGTLTNGPTFDSSNGGSIAFDGSNQYSSIGVSDFLTGITDYSLELWFNFDTLTNGGFYTLFSYGGYVPNGFLFQREGNKNVLRYAYDSTTLFDTVDTFTSVNEWNHAIVTIINGIPQKIYLNGVEKTTNTVTSSLSINSPKTVEIGRRTDTSEQYVDGKIAQVKIYNRALSQEEVQQNFNVTRGRFGV